MILTQFIPKSLKTLLKKKIKKTIFEEEIIALFFEKKLKKTDGLMIDVGANYGHSLVPFSKLGWTIIGFEPDPKNREVLFRNIDDNNLNKEKIEILNNAVSDEKKEYQFYTSKLSSGISALHKFDDSHELTSYTVNSIILKEFLQDRNISSVDFLKIDVEGFDFFVLKGFDFNLIKPTVVLAEYEDRKTEKLGYSKEEVVEYLKSYGYDILISEWEPIVQYGVSHKWVGIKTKIEDVKDTSWGNIVAVLPNYKQELYKILK